MITKYKLFENINPVDPCAMEKYDRAKLRLDGLNNCLEVLDKGK